MKKLLIGLATATLLFSCEKDKQEKAEKVLNINVGSEGSTIDPQLLTTSPSLQIQSLLSEGLARYNKDLKAVPGLAKSWEVSKDGKTWTFHLRDGLKWSDGSPITANDFKFAWLRALDPNTASSYAYMLYPIKGAEAYNEGKGTADQVGIDVKDDKTLVVHLTYPTPYFDSLVAFVTYFPTQKAFFEKHKDDFAQEPEDLLYSGPYILKKWVHNGGDMELVKNPNYYDAKDIKLDVINIKFLSNPGSILNAFKNNEIDYAELTAEQYDEFKNDKRVVKVPIAFTYYIAINAKIKSLSNVKIRRALNLAINKEDIVNNIFKGLATPAYTFTPEGVGMQGVKGDFVKEMGHTIPKFNVEKAKELLAEGLKEEGLKQMPELTIIANDDGSNKKVVESIQEQLSKNLGINLKVQMLTYKERISRMDRKDYELALTRWGADYQDPNTFLDLFVSNGGNNYNNYLNPKYDEYIKDASMQTDKVKRVKDFQNVEKILAEDMPIVPLYFTTSIYIVNPKVQGIFFSPFGAKVQLRDVSIKEGK